MVLHNSYGVNLMGLHRVWYAADSLLLQLVCMWTIYIVAIPVATDLPCTKYDRPMTTTKGLITD